ncbi:MAG: hypothetical protein ACYC0Z_01790, partial [Acidobacteriaceae bacterium]
MSESGVFKMNEVCRFKYPGFTTLSHFPHQKPHRQNGATPLWRWILMLMAITVVIVSQRAQAQAASAVDHHDPRDSQAVEQQVQGLLEKMTLEEEIHLIGGENAMYIPAIPRLGLPVV